MPYSKLVEESVMGEDVGLSERDRSVPTQGDCQSTTWRRQCTPRCTTKSKASPGRDDFQDPGRSFDLADSRFGGCLSRLRHLEKNLRQARRQREHQLASTANLGTVHREGTGSGAVVRTPAGLPSPKLGLVCAERPTAVVAGSG